MISLYASLSIILAEVSLLLLVICGTLVFLKLREQRKDKKALVQLTEQLKNDEENRLGVLSIKLQETQQLEGDALAAAAKEIHKKEIDFYIATMKIYASRNSSALQGLYLKIAELTESYAKLGTIGSKNCSAPPTESAANPSEFQNENIRLNLALESAQKNNDHLKKELDGAKNEMRETVAEFVSAFSGGRDAANEKIAKMEQEKGAKQLAEAEPSDAANETAAAIESAINSMPETEIVPLPEKEITATDNGTTEAASTNEDKNRAEDTEPSEPVNNIDSSGDDNKVTTKNTIDRVDESPPSPEDRPSTELLMGDAADLSGDDIDAILAATTDGGQAQSTATTDNSSSEKNVDSDDIDALLQDIDITTAGAMPDEKKKTEKAL